MKNQDQNTVEEYHRIVHDNISGYGITIINDKMYLIIDGKKTPLDALIIKESRRENN